MIKLSPTKPKEQQAIRAIGAITNIIALTALSIKNYKKTNRAIRDKI